MPFLPPNQQHQSTEGLSTPKPFTVGNILKKEITTWHLLYTMIHNHLKIYYFHCRSGVLED